jgi:hypothetical protein
MDSENEYLSKYLERFPTRFRGFIKDENNRKAFLESVKWEYEPIKVYRAVHCCKNVFESDFLNNIDEASVFSPNRSVPNTLECYSVSVNESIEEIKKALKFPNKRRHYFGIAVGEMNCKHGPASFDEDRPHHNWYIYFDSVKDLVNNFFIIVGDKCYEK